MFDIQESDWTRVPQPKCNLFREICRYSEGQNTIKILIARGGCGFNETGKVYKLVQGPSTHDIGQWYGMC